MQHGLAPFPKPWGLHRGHLKYPPGLVDYQGGKGFAIHILGDDHQGPATAGHRLQNRNNIRHAADLAVGQEKEGMVEAALPSVLIRDEVRGAVAAIKGHPLGDLHLCPQGFGFLHGDYPIGAHPVHGFRNHPTHFFVIAGAHGGHLTDGSPLYRGAAVGDPLHGSVHGELHATAEFHGIGSGGHIAQAFANHRLGEHGGGGGAIPRRVLGFGGHLLHQLGAQVFKGVGEFDFLGNRHPVINNVRGAKFLFQHHIAPLGPDGDPHRIGQGINTPLQGVSGGVGELDQFGHESKSWSTGLLSRLPYGRLPSPDPDLVTGAGLG